MSTPRRLGVVIVDDDRLARDGLAQLVAADPELECLSVVDDVRSAVAAVAELHPDILILDIQLSPGTGFDVLRELDSTRMPSVIFVTAYDQFAVQAFESHALDYVMKPFDDSRLFAALARAKRAWRAGDAAEIGARIAQVLAERDAVTGEAHSADSAMPHKRWLTRLAVRIGPRITFVATRDIDWIQADGYCARLHVRGRQVVVRDTLARLEHELDPQRFFRSHRSAIVNLERVRQLEPAASGEHALVLVDGTRVALARGRRERLELLMRG